MAAARTLVIKVISKLDTKNLAAKLEDFQDNFDQLLNWLRQINFL